jgi:hypothetical protein
MRYAIALCLSVFALASAGVHAETYHFGSGSAAPAQVVGGHDEHRHEEPRRYEHRHGHDHDHAHDHAHDHDHGEHRG